MIRLIWMLLLMLGTTYGQENISSTGKSQNESVFTWTPCSLSKLDSEVCVENNIYKFFSLLKENRTHGFEMSALPVEPFRIQNMTFDTQGIIRSVDYVKNTLKGLSAYEPLNVFAENAYSFSVTIFNPLVRLYTTSTHSGRILGINFHHQSEFVLSMKNVYSQVKVQSNFSETNPKHLICGNIEVKMKYKTCRLRQISGTIAAAGESEVEFAIAAVSNGTAEYIRKISNYLYSLNTFDEMFKSN